MPLKSPALSIDAAAELCLNQLVEDPAELSRFMDQAGLSPDALRRAIGTRSFAAGIIDYVASNEPLLLAVCANAGIKPETFMRVWHELNPAG
jgi:hypothetical protein